MLQRNTHSKNNTGTGTLSISNELATDEPPIPITWQFKQNVPYFPSHSTYNRQIISFGSLDIFTLKFIENLPHTTGRYIRSNWFCKKLTNNLTRKVTSIKIKIIYLIWLWQFYMLRVGVLYKTNTGNNLPFFKGKICFILLNTWILKTYFLLLIKSMYSFVLSQSSFLVTLPYHKHMPYLTWI